MKLFTEKHKTNSGIMTSLSMQPDGLQSSQSSVVSLPSVWWGCPSYNVWQQEMSGKAEFAKAEQNRRIKIEEAKANLEAEKLNAQAEIERAKGAAEAIRIENGSITSTYIQYLWVRQQNNIPNKVVYIPTEANLPILEAKK